MTTARHINDGKWCWVSKPALKRILDAAGDEQAGLARSVYLALCEIANDAGGDVHTFTVNKGLIAYRAGVSPVTVKRVLPDLERAGVVVVTRHNKGLKTASTYTLLAVPSMGLVDPTKGLTEPTKGLEQGAFQTRLYKNLKEPKEPLAPVGAEATAKAKVKLRERNPLLDALAAVDGSDPSQVTGMAWGGIGMALKAIKEVCPDLTPAEIKRRAGNYRLQMPDARITATALAKFWATCDRPPQSASAAQSFLKSDPL